MVSVRRGVGAPEVRQRARHVLFVEGNPDGLDVRVLDALLSPLVRVEPLGPSFSVRSAAQALHPAHPEYWFVIDRDDHDDAAVEATWAAFPDPQTHNLLIWRRKELENYFLEPAWVTQSRWCSATPDAITADLVAGAQRPLWVEAANRVLIGARNRVKRCPAPKLKRGVLRAASRAEVLDHLLASPALAALADAAGEALAPDAVAAAFDAQCAGLSGGADPLSWGVGRWRDLMGGKALFREMINRWFKVDDLAAPGRPLTGRRAERAVAAELLTRHRDGCPADLLALRDILQGAVGR